MTKQQENYQSRRRGSLSSVSQGNKSSKSSQKRQKFATPVKPKAAEPSEVVASGKPGPEALGLPPENDEKEPLAFTAEEIEALLCEDSELYDITMIFNNDTLQ